MSSSSKINVEYLFLPIAFDYGIGIGNCPCEVGFSYLNNTFESNTSARSLEDGTN